MMTLQHETASQIPVRFCVGDTVNVLHASWLPKVEKVTRTGVITAIRETALGPTYLVEGGVVYRSPRVLRLVQRGRR